MPVANIARATPLFASLAVVRDGSLMVGGEVNVIGLDTRPGVQGFVARLDPPPL